MDTLKKVPFELVEVEVFPDILEPNKFYYSEKYKVATHLCACGCEKEKPIPIKEGKWQITDKVKLTVTPSLQHRMQCQAHYIFSNGYANIVNYPLPKSMWYKDQTTHAPGGCPL